MPSPHADVPLHRVRLDGGQVGRPVRRVPGLGHASRRSGVAPRLRQRGRGTGDRSRPCRSARSTSTRRPRAAPASPSSTGCSAAAWCPARWSCWPASPGSASRRCCSRWPPRRRGPAGAACTSPARSRPPRCGCGPTGSARVDPDLFLAAETDLGAVLGHVDAVRPDLLVVDSVQTIVGGRASTASPGGVTQVREVAAALIQRRQGARHRDRAGRPRDQGRLDRRPAGARAPGRRRAAVRGRPALPAAAGAGGQEPVRPGRRGRLLRPRRRRHRRAARPERAVPVATAPVRRSGTCVTVTMEGRRPLVAEVQALVVRRRGSTAPRRATSGLDAVAGRDGARRARQARRRCDWRSADVYAATVGGVTAHRAGGRPGASRSRSRPPRASCRCRSARSCIGEVGLAGEVRRVPAVERRLAEAARLGFTRAVVPVDCGPAPDGVTAVEVPDVRGRARRAATRWCGA